MTRTTTSTEKLHEALELLNEAAREKGGELQKLIAEKYADLKSALGEAAQASGDWLKKEGKAATDSAKKAASTAK
jgi:uncharacterized protein YicC (UPF0701 family)